MLIRIILLLVLVVLRLWTSLRLYVTGRQNSLANLYWLAAAYVLGAIGVAFAPIPGNPLGALPVSFWVAMGGTIVFQVAHIPFVTQTFYQNRRSPAAWMWGLAVVTTAATVYGMVLSPSDVDQHPLVAAAQVLTCAVFGWHGWASYWAWQQVAKERFVEDWVRARYLLVIGYCGFQFAFGIVSFVRVVAAGGGATSTLGNAMTIISLVCTIAVTVLAYLAWAAPQGFLPMAQPQLPRASHGAGKLAWIQNGENAMKRMHFILGKDLAERTGQNEIICRGMLILAIQDQCGFDDPALIDGYLKKMGFREWERVLNDANLARRLANVGVQSSSEVIAQVQRTLVEKQSLFTMSSL